MGPVVRDLPFANLDVLIIDTSRHMRSLVRGVLHAFGVRVIREAADAAEAFREMQHTAPHVVITELVMDPLDGLEFTRMVRQADNSPDRYLPIIILTAHTERRLVEAARDAGVNEYMAKPVSAETLYARLYAAVFRQRPFVKSESYFGPDRRRRHNPAYSGPERRTAEF